MPLQVVVPALSMVRLRRLTLPVMFNAPVAEMVTEPVPSIVPPLHSSVPFVPTVRSPGPVSVPFERCRLSTVRSRPLPRVNVPFVILVKPSPVMVVPGFAV